MPGHIVGPVPQAAASGCKCGMIFDHKAKGAKVVEQICMARSVAVRPELSLDRPVMIAMLASLVLVAIILLLVFEAGAKGEVCLLNKLLGMRERMLSKTLILIRAPLPLLRSALNPVACPPRRMMPTLQLPALKQTPTIQFYIVWVQIWGICTAVGGGSGHDQ